MDLASWEQFFCDAGIPSDSAKQYALKFIENDIQNVDMIDLKESDLEKMEIRKIGHIKRILKYIKIENSPAMTDSFAISSNDDYITEIQKLREQLQIANRIKSPICCGEYLGALKQKLIRIKSDGRFYEIMGSCNMNDMQLGYLEREIDVFTEARHTCAHMGNKNTKNFTKEELESCTDCFNISKNWAFN